MRPLRPTPLAFLGLLGAATACDARGLVARTDPATQRDPLLLAHYRLDEVAGPVVTDSSGRGHHGTARGAVRFREGVFGNAAWLDGASSWIEVPAASELDLTRNFTLAAWVSTERTDTLGGIVGKGVGAGRSYALALDADAVRLSWDERSHAMPVVRAGVVVPARWIHVAATVEFDLTAHLYLDGQEVHRSVLPDGAEHPSAPLALGRTGLSQNSGWFQGMLDDVRIYGRALGPSEIRALGGGRLNAPPELDALASANPTAVPVGQSVDLLISAHDPERDAITYRWELGDGNVIESPARRAAHVFTQPGMFVIWPYIRDPFHPPIRGNPLAITVGSARLPEPYGLVAHWTFMSAPNGVAPDVTGHGHDATLGPGSRLVPGQMSDSHVLEIEDEDGAAEIAAPDGIDLAGELSLAAWVRPEAPGPYPLVTKTSSVEERTLVLGVAEDRLELRSLGSTAATVSGGHVALQKWQHVAATRDRAGVVRLYHQGVLVGQGTLPAAGLASAATPLSGERLFARLLERLYLGGADSRAEGAFVGGLADVRVYSYALSLAEIRWLASPITPVY